MGVYISRGQRTSKGRENHRKSNPPYKVWVYTIFRYCQTPPSVAFPRDTVKSLAPSCTVAISMGATENFGPHGRVRGCKAKETQQTLPFSEGFKLWNWSVDAVEVLKLFETAQFS